MEFMFFPVIHLYQEVTLRLPASLPTAGQRRSITPTAPGTFFILEADLVFLSRGRRSERGKADIVS